MKSIYEIVKTRKDDTEPFLRGLSALFADMDREYGKIATCYDFECRGCENNCCRTRFYHHTLLEYVYLMDGFDRLDSGQKKIIGNRAGEVIRIHRNADGNYPVHAMCPLNTSGLCGVYDRRPMICRLHGLPHELRKANGEVTRGPGCEEFHRKCGGMSYIPFDRTPFYVRMAQLEQQMRKVLGYTSKLKLTIAEMIAGKETPVI